jgi:hypothetical protein
MSTLRKLLYIDQNFGIHTEQSSTDYIYISAVSAKGFHITYTAGANLSNGDIVYDSGVNTVNKADPTNTAKSHVVGIVAISASSGDPVKVITSGPLTLVSESFSVNDPVFLSATGRPTITKPTASGTRIIKLGTMGTSTILNVWIQDLGKVT